jgi:hypothetical protein
VAAVTAGDITGTVILSLLTVGWAIAATLYYLAGRRAQRQLEDA